MHAILGELMLFRRLRQARLVQTRTPGTIRERDLGILWATWHTASVLGFGVGAVLIRLSFAAPLSGAMAFTVQALAAASFTSGVLVLGATRARHPGWAGLMGIAVLCWMA